MTEDWDVQQRTEYNFIRRYKRKTSDRHSKEDGETLERFYNRINLDDKRRKILDDSKMTSTRDCLDVLQCRDTCKPAKLTGSAAHGRTYLGDGDQASC